MELNVRNMTVVEKLQAMEMLWDDLCRNAERLEPPAWHKKILQAREEELRLEKDNFDDWDQAKTELWKSLS